MTPYRSVRALDRAKVVVVYRAYSPFLVAAAVVVATLLGAYLLTMALRAGIFVFFFFLPLPKLFARAEVVVESDARLVHVVRRRLFSRETKTVPLDRIAAVRIADATATSGLAFAFPQKHYCVVLELTDGRTVPLLSDGIPAMARSVDYHVKIAERVRAALLQAEGTPDR